MEINHAKEPVAGAGDIGGMSPVTASSVCGSIWPSSWPPEIGALAEETCRHRYRAKIIVDGVEVATGRDIATKPGR